mmetsp:Transcript_501/g.1401  ORF Transcript_501/g.1401 Transcript_501/m.1401 type:complete len:234 (-) Transcript_501:24-725(-)
MRSLLEDSKYYGDGYLDAEAEHEHEERQPKGRTTLKEGPVLQTFNEQGREQEDGCSGAHTRNDAGCDGSGTGTTGAALDSAVGGADFDTVEEFALAHDGEVEHVRGSDSSERCHPSDEVRARRACGSQPVGPVAQTQRGGHRGRGCTRIGGQPLLRRLCVACVSVGVVVERVVALVGPLCSHGGQQAPRGHHAQVQQHVHWNHEREPQRGEDGFARVWVHDAVPVLERPVQTS